MKINVTYDNERKPWLSVSTFDKKGKYGVSKVTKFYGENAVLLFEILVNKGLPESLHKKIDDFCVVNNLDFDWILVNFQSINFIFFNHLIGEDDDKFEFSMDLTSIIFYEEESYSKIIRKVFSHYMHNYLIKNEDKESNESSEEEFTIPEELYTKIYDFCEEYGLWFSCNLNKETNCMTFEFADSEDDKVHFDMNTDIISMHPDDILNRIMYILNTRYSIKYKKRPDNFSCIKNPMCSEHDVYTIKPYSKRFFVEIKKYLLHKIDKYGFVTLNDLHSFLGIPYDNMNDEYGWTNLSKIRCIKGDDKMSLIMPKAMRIKDPLIEMATPFGAYIDGTSVTIKDMEIIISNRLRELGYSQDVIDVLQYTLNVGAILAKDGDHRTLNELRYLAGLGPIENNETK